MSDTSNVHGRGWRVQDEVQDAAPEDEVLTPEERLGAARAFTGTGPLIGIDQLATGPLSSLDLFIDDRPTQLLSISDYPTPVLKAIDPSSIRGRSQTAERPRREMPGRSPRDGRLRPDAPFKGGIVAPGSEAPANRPIAPAAIASHGELGDIAQIATQLLPAIGVRVESYGTLMRGLVKRSGVYAVAALGSPMVSLLLTPFLVRFLPPTDYGALAVLNTLIGLAAGITQLGLGFAFFRAYNFDYSTGRDKHAVLATVSLLLILVSLPVAAAMAAFAPEVSALLFGRSSFSTDIALAACVILIQNLTVPGLAWMRAENRAAFFSMLSISNLLITLLGNIVLVGFLRWGIAGSMIANGAGYASIVVCTYPLIFIRAGLRIRRDVAWSLLTFGVPQIMSFISVWVLQLSDRYLLSIFGTLAETASYSVAYSLGSVLSAIVLAPFSLAWPTAMYSIAKRKDAPAVFREVFRWFSTLLLFAAFGLSLTSTLLFHWLFPASYSSAAPVIPIVAASIVFYGLYVILMVGANVRRKTWMQAAFTTAAALANFGLNLILIPRFGAMGAAASTLIAYFVLAVIAFVANQLVYPVPYDVLRLALAAIVGLALYYQTIALPQAWGAEWAGPAGVLGLVVYGIWLALLGKSARSARTRAEQSQKMPS